MSKVDSPADGRTIALDEHAVDYEIRRSGDATEPRIDVDIHGIRVVLPDGAATDPEELLLENSEWVLEKKAKYDRYREQAPDRTFEPGSTFPYLGEPHEVVVESRSASAVEEGTLRLAEHHVEQTSIQRALERLYRRKAREIFTDTADRYASEMGVEYDTIELRNQRTIWGSCSTSGTLSLNWRLIMAPRDVADYVLVHELAHLREANHTRRFWQLVEEQLPDYQEHADWLNENSVRLIFTEDDL